jgi:hypothetical protein
MKHANTSFFLIALTAAVTGCDYGPTCSVIDEVELDAALADPECPEVNIGRFPDANAPWTWNGPTDLLRVTAARPLDLHFGLVAIDRVEVEGVDLVTGAVVDSVRAVDVVSASFTSDTVTDVEIQLRPDAGFDTQRASGVLQLSASRTLRRFHLSTVDGSLATAASGASVTLKGVDWDNLELTVSNGAMPTGDLQVDAAPLVQLQKFGINMQRVYAFGAAADFAEYVTWLDGEGYAGAFLVCALDVARLDDCVPFAG